MECIKCGKKENLLNLKFHFGNVTTSTAIVDKKYDLNTMRDVYTRQTTTRYSFSPVPEIYSVCETCANGHKKKKDRIDHLKAALAILTIIASILLIIFTPSECIIFYIILIIASLVVLYKTFSDDRITDLSLAIVFFEKEKGLEPDINEKYTQAAAEDIILTLFHKGKIKKEGFKNMATEAQYYNMMKNK